VVASRLLDRYEVWLSGVEGFFAALSMTILKERVVKCPTVMGFDLVALVDSRSGSAG